MKHTSTLTKLAVSSIASLLFACQPVSKESSYNSELPDTTLGTLDTTVAGESEPTVQVKKISAEEKKKILSSLRKKYDEFQSVTWYSSKDQARYRNVNQVSLYMGDTKNDLFLRFRVAYEGEDWVFVQSYKFLLDGEVSDHIPSVDVVRDNDGGDVWEITDEPADPEIIALARRISEAKVAKIRYEGKEHRYDRVITSKEKKAIREILTAYDSLTK